LASDVDNAAAPQPLKPDEPEALQRQQPQQQEMPDEPAPEPLTQADQSSAEPRAASNGGDREPGPRGSRRVLCHGEVLVMLGYYGWLTSADPIEHPDTRRNGGRIYVSRGDVACGTELSAGDRVVFYVYVDSRGLGAEEVRFQGEGDEDSAERRPRERDAPRRSRSCAPAARFRSPPSSDRAGAELPKGLRFDAAEFVPAAEAPSMRAGAAPFVPPAFGAPAQLAPAPGMRAAAAEFVPSAPAVTSAAFVGGPSATTAAPKWNFVAINAAYFSDDSDDEDSDSDAEGVVAAKRASSSAGSSSTGVPSDAEEDQGDFLEPPPGLPLPPGLPVPMRSSKFPVGIRPPPGLSLS